MFSAESSPISFSLALMTGKNWRISSHPPPQKKKPHKVTIFYGRFQSVCDTALGSYAVCAEVSEECTVHINHYHYELAIQVLAVT